MIELSDKVQEKIFEQLQKQQDKIGFRVSILGRGRYGFDYDFRFISQEEIAADDEKIELEKFAVFVDAPSVKHLQGAKLDYMERGNQAGISVFNPNPLWEDEVAQKLQNLIDQEINPAIASHGGFLVLRNVKDDTAYIELGGGCQGCGMANVTLRNGVEVVIKHKIPEIKNVVDVTDHAAGENPYFEPKASS